MQPNYLQYAQLINQAGDRTGALSQLGQSIDQSQEMALQRQQLERQAANDARAAKLSDLQYNAGNLNLQQDRAKSLALIDQYGTGDRPDFQTQLSDATSFQNQQALELAKQEKQAAKIQKHWQLVDHFTKAGATPEFITEFTKLGMKQDPEMAGMADSVNFVSKDKMIVTRPFAEGELKDPLTGKPMPAGTYKVEAKRTNDPLNPYQPISVETVEDKQPKHVPEGAAVPDGKGGWKIPAPKKEKPIIINTGGRGGGKPPVGYRFTADGNLEAIPGGPADQKVTAAGKAQEGGVAAIDTAINSIKDLLTHPGRLSATGASSLTNKIAIPGGAASTFLTKLDAFKSQMFVPMVQQLKGMGQLSDAEGKRLVAAVGALEPNMSESEFKSSLETILTELKSTRERVAKPLTRAEYTPAVPVTPQNRPKSKKADPLGIL